MNVVKNPFSGPKTLWQRLTWPSLATAWNAGYLKGTADATPAVPASAVQRQIVVTPRFVKIPVRLSLAPAFGSRAFEDWLENQRKTAGVPDGIVPNPDYRDQENGVVTFTYMWSSTEVIPST